MIKKQYDLLRKLTQSLEEGQMSIKPSAEMSEEELNEESHKIVVSMFSFARTLAWTVNANQKELENFIISETIKELVFHLKINH